MTEPTIGEIIDAMWLVREKRREIAARDKELSGRQHRLELMLIEALDAQKTRKGEGGKASASIKVSIEPQASDWQKAKAWMLRHKDLSLFQHRLAPAVYRDLLKEYPKGIPGIESFEKRSIHLTTLKPKSE